MRCFIVQLYFVKMMEGLQFPKCTATMASWLSKRKSQTESESELCLQWQRVSVKKQQFLSRKRKGGQGFNFLVFRTSHRKSNSGWDFGVSEGNGCKLMNTGSIILANKNARHMTQTP